MTTLSRATPTLTSYDVLKSVALLLMFIDHIGAYIYTDIDLLRVIGRWCVPMWFFLIGYARTRRMDTYILICAVLINASDAVTGHSPISINILFVFLGIRLIIDPVADFMFSSKANFILGASILAGLAVPSNMITDYGTIGLSLALFGYAVRHKKTIPKQYFDWMIHFTITLFIVTQVLLFDLDMTHSIIFALGMCPVVLWLLSFKPQTYITPSVIKYPLQLMGRHTLVLYTIHLILLRAYASEFFNHLTF